MNDTNNVRTRYNPRSDSERITEVLGLIHQYGGIDGEHHKQWVLDQVVRILADDYDHWVKLQKEGEDGPDTYTWETGIAP